MKKVFLLIAVIVFSLAQLSAQQAGSAEDMKSMGHIMLNTGDFKWMDAPPGLPPGAKVSVLSGDPSKPGPFTIRAMFPENYKVLPHTHPSYENVVVLEGSLYMGSGEKVEESKAMKLDAGGYSAIPANAPHYVFCKDKVTLQINGDGPFAINYINAADDPRNKK